MAFKMRNEGGTFKSMGSSAMKTRRPSQKPPQGEDLIAGDKNFTKKEQRKDARLEDKNNDAAARREYMEMMKKKSPLEKGEIDPETGTLYQDGMAVSDASNARSEFKHSISEIEAAKALGSKKVDRVQKRAGKKSSKLSKKVKFGGKSRVGRVNNRRRTKSKKASNKADEVTTKRFQNTEQGGKDGYNRLIERDNKERKERAAERAASTRQRTLKGEF